MDMIQNRRSIRNEANLQSAKSKDLTESDFTLNSDGVDQRKKIVQFEHRIDLLTLPP